MRIVAALALIGACAPAFAQAPAPAKPAAAAKSAPAKPVPAKSAHETAPLAERIALQSDLVWTSYLNSIADGAWGERSTAAVKAYQKHKGARETGTLGPDERAALAAKVRAKQAEVGWHMVGDADGTRIGVPVKLMPQGGKGKTTGGHWQSAHGEIQIDTFRQPSPATLAVVHSIERKNPGRRITYHVLKPDFFVLSGTQGPKKFYMRAEAGRGEVRGFTVLYDTAAERIMAPILVAISSAFAPFPTTAAASNGAPVRRKVEYATSVIVSPAGDIVTDREAIDGCKVIVVNGLGNSRLGNAERIADDTTTGLALLHVYGAHDFKPLALGSAAKGEVTLVGIPDPQTQGGKDSVSTAKAHMLVSNDSGMLEPAATPGFAGSAVIDADTGFAGVVVQQPRIVAGPASGASASSLAGPDAIRKFLTAQNIAFASGQASVAFAKDSGVRVICVRK